MLLREFYVVTRTPPAAAHAREDRCTVTRRANGARSAASDAPAPRAKARPAFPAIPTTNLTSTRDLSARRRATDVVRVGRSPTDARGLGPPAGAAPPKAHDGRATACSCSVS